MNHRKIYRDAAQLAAIQLDRPFTAQDMARIEACIVQSRIATDIGANWFPALEMLANLTPTFSTETFKPLNPLETVQEAIDESTRRIAGMFSPRLPNVNDTTEQS
jgi:hypothetical protein